MSLSMMIRKKIGNKSITFVVSGDTLFDCQQEVQRLSFRDIEKCGRCNSDDLRLYSYIAAGKYKYLKVICNSCKGSAQFSHPERDPKTFYLKKGKTGKVKWEPYTNPKDKKQNQDAPPPPDEPPEEQDDLPF